VRDEEKRDFIPPNARDGAEVSLRKPTLSQERKGKKKRRLAPFEMTVWGWTVGKKDSVCCVRNDGSGGGRGCES